ncbi:MAG: ATP-binding protein [Oxalobacter sp.]|nr:MAG: ATP-binding protein [Oxalobacter sp.]
MDALEKLLSRAETLLARVETMLPPATPVVDWQASTAFRWRTRRGQPGSAFLQAVKHISAISLHDLQHVDRQKQVLVQNTQQFVAGKPANNVLLTGSRGTGKSSLVKACLNHFAPQGLRLIEVDRGDLADLMDIVDLVADRHEKFILYCDDLSFEEGDTSYKALKVALDGSVGTQSNNVLIYATSNRRHLMPERVSDNREVSRGQDGDLHPGETVEEKISLSERFGIWLSFYPFSQDEYLDIVANWLRAFGCADAAVEAARTEALRWALQRGSRSGRIAWQFAKDHVGRMK